MVKWDKVVFIAALVCYGIGLSALGLALVFDHAFLQFAFIVGIYGGVILNIVAVKMRDQIAESREQSGK